jgi:hypothetical protein
MNATVKATNAIKWIDALKGGKNGFKKGVESLGQYIRTFDEDGWLIDIDTSSEFPNSYCCLGVGCRVLNIEENWVHEFSEKLTERVGLYDSEGSFYDPATENEVVLMGKTSIAEVNDGVYSTDTTFTNMRKFILNHIDNIFIPPVAKKLKQHYGK